MSEETDFSAGLVVMEDEQMGYEREVTVIQKQSASVGEKSTVMMTGEEFTRESMPEKEVGKEGLGLSELSSFLLGSFQSLHSSQGSERDRMIPYVLPLEEVMVLQFEDTLSEMDHRNFNLIYESLLLEGKAGNLTDLTIGMVLAEKPPALLQVMYGRLKHLIISSEAFQKKRRLRMLLELGQNKLVKERGWENTPKELGIQGLVGKEGEKAP